MDIRIDIPYMMNVMEKFINTPSPVSYFEQVNPLLETYAKELGLEVTYDRKRTGYITLEGEDSSKTVCVGAHLDTLGLIVRRIESDGTLRVRNLGGINFNSIEGESVVLYTRDGRSYTGLVVCQSHSVHVYDDARTLVRDENSMLVILDEDVHTKEEVKALGVENGDIIAIEPRFTVTEKGFIKSRFIDNKASVAAVFAVLKYLKETEQKPKFRTMFAFPHYEEIGHGGSYVPEEVEEYVALDIGVIGPDHNGSEFDVSICVKDNFSPYDRGLTDRIINQAKKIGIDFVEDVFYRYGTDANAAIRAGNNLYAAAFGMGTYASHNMERTHTDAVVGTAKLLAAYVLDL